VLSDNYIFGLALILSTLFSNAHLRAVSTCVLTCDSTCDSVARLWHVMPSQCNAACSFDLIPFVATGESTFPSEAFARTRKFEFQISNAARNK
jgi:hypothetical protein